MSTLEAIRYDANTKALQVLNQRLLPFETKFDTVTGTEDGWSAIREMRVRGAPAIAIVGVLSLVVELQKPTQASTAAEFAEFVKKQLDYLVTARPTAVNMGEAAERISELAKVLASKPDATVESVKDAVIKEMEAFLPKDIADNRAIGKYGAEEIMKGKPPGTKVSVLTHCNTGSLATAGYGTALGVIRALHEAGNLEHAYCTETRPYNQGCRLTAYELVYEKIPSTLITDSMAAALMKNRKIDAVVVGADRVVANGDTANKIGTYQLAIVADYHNVPYYIAAPKTSIDMNIDHGDKIVIEERPHEELTSVNGTPVAAPGIGVWNPAFDVAPAKIITGIMTEVGVALKAPGETEFDLKPLFSK
eukprot:m.338171 g.338171  ORF g.338171 m.338171 type:complete len:363 (+) comp18328_c0_seq1:19-1107(+)